MSGFGIVINRHNDREGSQYAFDLVESFLLIQSPEEFGSFTKRTIKRFHNPLEFVDKDLEVDCKPNKSTKLRNIYWDRPVENLGDFDFIWVSTIIITYPTNNFQVSHDELGYFSGNGRACEFQKLKGFFQVNEVLKNVLVKTGKHLSSVIFGFWPFDSNIVKKYPHSVWANGLKDFGDNSNKLSHRIGCSLE